MKDPVARWRDEHVRFERLLDLLENQLNCFHQGVRPDYGRMLDVMRYMRQYADAVHHPREDLAFAKLAQRAPSHLPAVHALLDEHEIITSRGEALVLLLEEVLDGAFVERKQVEEPGREYIRRLRDHIRREERLFPAVTRWLRLVDWEAIDVQVPERPDPIAQTLLEGEAA